MLSLIILIIMAAIAWFLLPQPKVSLDNSASTIGSSSGSSQGSPSSNPSPSPNSSPPSSDSSAPNSTSGLLPIIECPEYPSNWPSIPTNRGKFASLGERCLIECAEHLFHKPFPKRRPDWLINPETGYRLELDGYCEELALAVEYNGKQHYARTGFHRTENDLTRQQYRDKVKREICQQRGIRLIVVPYTVPLQDIPDWFYNQLKSPDLPHESEA
jgi:hypothetical protein